MNNQYTQSGFFDLVDRYEQLSKAGDPLEKLNNLIPWDKFRTPLQRALSKKRKSNAGRPPYDCVLMFKILVLQSLYNLSDHQIEFQIRDRLSFMRFLDLKLHSRIPDEKTVWWFREQLVQNRAIDKLFVKFNEYLDSEGYQAECGSIIDASIVEVPKQRNSRESNKKIKEGETPDHWKENPNKCRQKDVEARWTKKNNETYYGYKDHIGIDVKHKLIRKFKVTPASTSDSVCFKELLDKKNEDKRVWADSAYKTLNNDKLLKKNNFINKIHYRTKLGGGGWISDNHKRENNRRTKIRKRVEHIFGFIENSMNHKFIKTIGIKRAKWKIGMMNLVYNICRYQQLARSDVA